MQQARTVEDTERKKRLARLKVAGMREQWLEIEQRDRLRDPEYLPEPDDEEEETSISPEEA